jgi:hypothetical protein
VEIQEVAGAKGFPTANSGNSHFPLFSSHQSNWGPGTNAGSMSILGKHQLYDNCRVRTSDKRKEGYSTMLNTLEIREIHWMNYLGVNKACPRKAGASPERLVTLRCRKPTSCTRR